MHEVSIAQIICWHCRFRPSCSLHQVQQDQSFQPVLRTVVRPCAAVCNGLSQCLPPQLLACLCKQLTAVWNRLDMPALSCSTTCCADAKRRSYAFALASASCLLALVLLTTAPTMASRALAYTSVK
jgi:hypothetical protein